MHRRSVLATMLGIPAASQIPALSAPSERPVMKTTPARYPLRHCLKEADAYRQCLTFMLLSLAISEAKELTGLPPGQFVAVSRACQADIVRMQLASMPEHFATDEWANPLLRIGGWIEVEDLPQSEVLITTPRGYVRIYNVDCVHARSLFPAPENG